MVAEHAGFKFKRCPATFVGAREKRVVSEARAGLLEDLTRRERMKLPAKLFQALEYAQFLLELQKAEPTT